MALTPLYADGSQSYIAYEEEDAFNTLNGSPDMTYLRTTGNTLDLTKSTFLSDELRNNRELMELRHGNLAPAGDINFELVHTEFDALLEAALGGEWDTNVLLQGTNFRSFTIEKGFTDIDEYFLFTGCVVNTLSINLNPESMITGTFGFLCGGTTLAQSARDGSITASQTGSPYDSFTAEIKEGTGGSPSAVTYVTSLTMNLNNGVVPNYILGDDNPVEMSLGRSNFSGTFTCLFKNDTFWDKFKDETETGIDVVLNDPTAALSYTFEFDNVKYTAASTPVADEGSIIQTFDWQALYDDTLTSNVRITRDSTP